LTLDDDDSVPVIIAPDDVKLVHLMYASVDEAAPLARLTLNVVVYVPVDVDENTQLPVVELAANMIVVPPTLAELKLISNCIGTF